MKRIGIVCALYFEASCFMPGKPPAQQPVRLNESTALIVSGMGRDRAKQAAHKLIGENVDCLVSFGTAGALAPALRPGDLLLPQTIVVANAAASQAQPGPDQADSHVVNSGLPAPAIQRLSRQNIPIHTGPLACADEPVTSSAGKRRLFGQTGAIAVDMESAGVLEAAQESGLQGYAARVIVDPADLALPEIVLREVDDFGQINNLALALRLITSPAQIPHLLRLAKASHQAGKTMRLVARELLK